MIEVVKDNGAIPNVGWFAKFKVGLTKSSAKLSDGISGIFTKRRLDEDTLEKLEELLIEADLGSATAARLTTEFAHTRFGKEVTPEEVRRALARQIETILIPVVKPLKFNVLNKPSVVIVVGVNGTGKTTTIGKLAKQLRSQGQRVFLAAGDTFRAAAVSQLEIWGQRADCPVLARPQGSDSAALAFDALTLARAQQANILLIDTAGRLHNKEYLMAELEKMQRVLRKQDETAPHGCLLILDATTGQNAHSQVETFCNIVKVSGLILTKLDGSARGGVLVALAARFGLPVHAIGVGEGIDDLYPFNAGQFACSLMGVEEYDSKR
jgi:fused signal recognition particle receptor